MSEYPDLNKLNDKVSGRIWKIKDYLMGKVLTLIDATFSDMKQRKAQKDLVKEIFHSNEYFSDEIDDFFRMYAEHKSEKFNCQMVKPAEVTFNENPFKK